MMWIVARWWRRRDRPARPEDRRSLETLLEEFVAIDTETTGLDANRDAIVSLSVVPIRGGSPTPGYDTLVNPGRPIPPTATRIHGITDAMVSAAPRLVEVLDEIETVLGDRVVVGHGVAFDLALLERERRVRHRPPLPNTTLCTMRLAVALHPGWGMDVTLEALASRVGVPVVGRHTARGDALVAGAIMVKLLPELARRGHRTLADAVWLQHGARL